MPSLRIVLDPERQGLGLNVDPAKIVHLSNDAEIVVTGLPDGMASGAPSMAFAFVLPDGHAVIAETSWKLFAAAYAALAGKFGVTVPESERADLSGIALQYDEPVTGQKVQMNIQSDDLPQWFECELCGTRIAEPPGVEGSQRIAQWVRRHYREKHPRWPEPKVAS